MLTALISLAFFVGLTLGLIISRFCPQKLDIGIGIARMDNPDGRDESESWKEGR